MTKPFDTTPKDLVEAAPAEWVASFGLTTDPTKIVIIDADVSVVTADADKVIRVDDEHPWILHLEFQASHETDLARRLLRYNALLQRRHGCPVASVLYLLRREANVPRLTGEFEVIAPVVPGWTFRYSVIRVWEVPVETWLTGGLRLLPFAPIAKVAKDDVSAVIERMKARLDEEAPEAVKRHLWVATELMLGLKYEAAFIQQLLRGIGHMEESTIYQMILERGKKVGHLSGLAEGLAEGVAEGRVREARQLLLRQGTKKFGIPTPAAFAVLDSLHEPERLEDLADRLLDVSTWDELFSGL